MQVPRFPCSYGRWVTTLLLLAQAQAVRSAEMWGNLTLDGFPHTFDVFAPTAPSQGLVFLHGGGGTKEGLEASLNVTLSWAEDNGVLLAFPQGQSLQSCKQPPCSAFTWNNFVMDSGQDDVAFLRKLAAELRNSVFPDADAAPTPAAASFPTLPPGARLSLAGHSNGGMMANRVWCETGDAVFDAFASFEGPMSSWFDANVTRAANREACSAPSRAEPPPYMSVIAFNDTVIGHTPATHLDDETWSLALKDISLSPYAFVNHAVINDLDVFARVRAPLRCGEWPSRSPSVVTDRVQLFSACGGAAALTALIGESDDGTCSTLSQGHCIKFLQERLGRGLLDFTLAWLARLPSEVNVLKE